jgi:hypothetical protein
LACHVASVALSPCWLCSMHCINTFCKFQGLFRRYRTSRHRSSTLATVTRCKSIYETTSIILWPFRSVKAQFLKRLGKQRPKTLRLRLCHPLMPMESLQ